MPQSGSISSDPGSPKSAEVGKTGLLRWSIAKSNGHAWVQCSQPRLIAVGGGMRGGHRAPPHQRARQPALLDAEDRAFHQPRAVAADVLPRGLLVVAVDPAFVEHDEVLVGLEARRQRPDRRQVLLHVDHLVQHLELAAGGPPVGGSLTVVTKNMRAGYLRKNGVLYSAAATVTEYFDLSPSPGGQIMVVTTVVDDPRYLVQPLIVSSHFKKEADGSKWDPTPCSARW